MKRWLLTLPVLLAGMAGLVRADYFLIVINTGTGTAAPADPGRPMGMMPPPTTTTNAADFVGVIVESENLMPTPAAQKKQFEERFVPLSVKFRNHTLKVSRMSSLSLASLYSEPHADNPKDVRVRPNVHAKFAELARPDAKNKTAPLDLAEFALTHGLVDKFVETMDKLAQDDKEKDTPAVKNYRTIKAKIDAKIEDHVPDVPWVQRLLKSGFKEKKSDHYFVVHNVDSKYESEVKSRLTRLEDTFRTFYYWHAVLKGTVLPVPAERLVVIVAHNEDDENLKEFRAMADGGEDRLSKRHEDGFFARREGILYLSLSSREPAFEKLSAFAKKKLDGANKTVEEVLNTKQTAQVQPNQPDYWVLCLAVKVLEADAERLAVSHHGARQLTYACGRTLPHYVVAPEWIQYGLGSFFETPLGAPWTSPATPSVVHLKLCREILEKGGVNTGEVLKQVVTDGYFKEAGDAEEGDHTAAQAKARALAWGLTYYLAQMKPDRLRAYYEELDKMPRDLPLDTETLLNCFARAFGTVDTDRKVNAVKLKAVADDWKEYLRQTSPNDGVRVVEGLAETVKAYQAILKQSSPGTMP